MPLRGFPHKFHVPVNTDTRLGDEYSDSLDARASWIELEMGSYTLTGFCPAMMPYGTVSVRSSHYGKLAKVLGTYQEQLDRGLLVRIVERCLDGSSNAFAGITDQTSKAPLPASCYTCI